MHATFAVEVEGLVKRYPKAPVNAVDGVSFTVDRGEVFGLLGPNGAGKTTTVGMLTTRVRPTAGVARVGGVDVVARPGRARAACSRSCRSAATSTARSRSASNLIFHAAYHGVPAAEREPRAPTSCSSSSGCADRGGRQARHRSRAARRSG